MNVITTNNAKTTFLKTDSNEIATPNVRQAYTVSALGCVDETKQQQQQQIYREKKLTEKE